MTAERYLKDYVRLGAVKGATLRLANVYGPGPEVSQNDRGILNKMIRRASAGEALYLLENAERKRDYVFVEDVVFAFLLAGINVDILEGGYYVIGTGQGYTFEESFAMVADRAHKKYGRKILVERRKSEEALPPIEDRDFVADSTRFEKSAGWKPEVELASGIDRTLEVVCSPVRS